MSEYLSPRISEIISHHAQAKTANVMRIGGLLKSGFNAGRSFFSSAGKAKPPIKPPVPSVKPPVPAASPTVPKVGPTTAPKVGPKPSPGPKTGPAPSPAPAPTTSPAPAAGGGWRGTLWNGTKNLGSQLAWGAGMSAIPSVYDHFFPGQQPGQQPGMIPGSPSGNPNDFYSQFSNFYNQNPAMAQQVSPQFHSLLSRQDELRNYFNKTGQMPVDPMQPQHQSPQASQYAQQPDNDEVIPEEQLIAAKELLLKDEMQAEMQKFRQQRQKAIMDRLKSDPDGAAVIKHMETHGKPVTPETVKAEGQQLSQQFAQSQSQGDMRPFDQWVTDMMQPQAQNFAFDAGVARRKMAGLLPTQKRISLDDIALLRQVSNQRKHASLLNILTSPEESMIGMSGSDLASSLVARSGVVKPQVALPPTPAPSPARTALSVSGSAPPSPPSLPPPPSTPTGSYTGPDTIRGFVQQKTPDWMHSYFAPGTLGGAAIDTMDRAAPAKQPQRPGYEVKPTIQPATIAPAWQGPRQTIQPATLPKSGASTPTTTPAVPTAPSTTVASVPKPQSNLNQRMQKMQTSGSLQNAFVKRNF